MKIHPFAAMLFSCLLIASIMMPVNALPGNSGNRNRSADLSNQTIRSNHDGNGFEIWLDGKNTLQCTGLHTKGQCDIPPGLIDVQSVSVGSDFVVAQLGNGSIIVWGSNAQGQGNVPPNLENVIDFTSTSTGSVAVLLKNGTVIAWGNNNKGQTNVPPILANNVTYVVGANSNFIALTTQGDVVAWGDNTFGQCNIPTGMGKIVNIAVGSYHSIALAENGTVFSWGWNGRGQCDIPPDIGKVISISSGMETSLLLLENGTILVRGPPAAPANTPGTGLYSSIVRSNFDTTDPWDHESVAITENGDILIWPWNYLNSDNFTTVGSDIYLIWVPSQGIFNLKRVCDKDLLDQHNRSMIYETIHTNPGLHFRDLCRSMGINRGTMSYHLAVLLSSRKVVRMEYAGKTGYFSNKCYLGDRDRKLLMDLKNPARMNLLQNLHIHGYLGRGDLIVHTGLSSSAAAWHLKSLSDEGIVQIKKIGREAYYSLHPEIAPYLTYLMTEVPGIVDFHEGDTQNSLAVIT